MTVTASEKRLRIAFVGAGLIGQERFRAVQKLKEMGRNIQACGLLEPAAPLAAEARDRFGVATCRDLSELLALRPDWVFIATPHDVAVNATGMALEAGCNVLVEKPLGRTYAEALAVTRRATRPDQLFVGFNYRFLDGIVRAWQDVREGRFGEIVSINIIMGHGHSPSVRGSWKLDPVRVGGGCLIDPGIHLLDLCRLFCQGGPRVLGGWGREGFWGPGVEDEVHLLMQAPSGFALNLQVSLVRWRSIFNLEIHGSDGYGIVTGKNRSFGPQRYVRGQRWGWAGASGKAQRDTETVAIETSGDDSFFKETAALLVPDTEAAIRPCTAAESLATMKLLEECRAAAGIGSAVDGLS